MKLLLLNSLAGFGGAERALLEVVASLSESSRDCEIFVILGEPGSLEDDLRTFGASVTVAPMPAGLASAGDASAGGPSGTSVSPWNVLLRLGVASPWIAAYTRRLGRIIAQVGPDLVHTNGFKMHLMGVWAAPRSVPVVWHIHDFVGSRPLMSRLLRLNTGRCAAIIANSDSVAADVRTMLGREREVTTIYNSVDLQTFAPTGPRADLDALAGMSAAPPDAVRVGLLATMARWKGHEVFLRALAMLGELNLRAYIIGGPVYRTVGSQHTLEELRQMVSAFGLDARVGFTGFVRDPAAALRALDIVIHASTAPEPFGLAIAEGLACGRAVIVSRAGGAMEIIREGSDALAHRAGDPGDLARTIAHLANDANLRHALGAAARATAERSFTRARLGLDLNSLYGTVMKGAANGQNAAAAH